MLLDKSRAESNVPEKCVSGLLRSTWAPFKILYITKFAQSPVKIQSFEISFLYQDIVLWYS